MDNTTEAALRDALDFLTAIRQREVQMEGAAISTRSWHEMENAYNQLRDKIDAELRRIKQALSQPSPASSTEQAILAPECCDEFDTNPDCVCPHEHWHVGKAGTCLDIHVEEAGYTHLTIDFGDGSHEVELHGISTLNAARPIAFLWAGAILRQSLSPSSGEPASVAVDYKAEFEAAMEARDAAGILGTSPAETISMLNAELTALSKPTPVEAGLRERIEELQDTLNYLAKWVERGMFDKQVGRDAISVIAHYPTMPWNEGRWDVDHKPYAEAFYKAFPKAKEQTDGS